MVQKSGLRAYFLPAELLKSLLAFINSLDFETHSAKEKPKQI